MARGAPLVQARRVEGELDRLRGGQVRVVRPWPRVARLRDELPAEARGRVLRNVPEALAAKDIKEVVREKGEQRDGRLDDELARDE